MSNLVLKEYFDTLIALTVDHYFQLLIIDDFCIARIVKVIIKINISKVINKNILVLSLNCQSLTDLGQYLYPHTNYNVMTAPVLNNNYQDDSSG